MKKILFIFAGVLLLTTPHISFAENVPCSAAAASCTCTDADGTSSSLTDSSITDSYSCASRCNDLGAASYKLFCDESTLTPTISGEIATYLDEIAAALGIQTITKEDPAIPALNVPIPGLDLTDSVRVDTNGYVTTNMIGLYVNAVFSYAIVLAAIFGVLMLTLAGFQYMTAAGNKSAVSKAKTRMQNVIFGLVILMATYSIAFLIDPRTTYFNALDLNYVDPIDYINSSGDAVGPIGNIGDATLPTGITCDQSGIDSLWDIAYSSKGRVNYRFGGKIGGAPPYSSEKKSDPNTGIAYSTFCPEDSLCLDCSGYADFLSQCAGLPSLGASTEQIFGSSAEKVTSCGSDSVNDQTLVPGDVLGWTPGTAGEKYGHIFTYIGDGKIADAHGSGRANGSAVGIYSVTWACKRYGNALHIRRR